MAHPYKQQPAKKFFASRRWWLALLTTLLLFGCVILGFFKNETVYESLLIALVAIPVTFMGATTVDKIFENKKD